MPPPIRRPPNDYGWGFRTYGGMLYLRKNLITRPPSHLDHSDGRYQPALSSSPRRGGISHGRRSKNGTYGLIPMRPHLELCDESDCGRFCKTPSRRDLRPSTTGVAFDGAPGKYPLSSSPDIVVFIRNCVGFPIANSICLRPGSVLGFLSWTSVHFCLIKPRLRYLSWGTLHAHSQSICSNPPRSLLLLHYPEHLYYQCVPNLH